MFVFKHPKYYTELRKRNREVLRSGRGLAVNQAPHVSDQAISSEAGDGERERATGPGLKLPGPRPISNANKGLIHRRQASSNKLKETQASSDKHQAPRRKRQA